jgi:2-octaprenyl-6-methoxyphenol hydroxylase
VSDYSECMNIPEHTEVIIAGGGLVGNALALALDKVGITSVVIDPLDRAKQTDGSFDGRTSAIALASVRILEHVGAWQFIADHAQPINDIRVCDQNKPGIVHYDHKEVGNEPFGYITENRILRQGLYTALENATHVSEVNPAKVLGVTRNKHSITANLENGHAITAPLVVAADGRFSGLRTKEGMAHKVIGYSQTAIVTVIAHERPHNGLAVEAFFPAGPFAVLPLTGNRSGIVWTESDANAPHYLALSDDQFLAEMQKRMGNAADNVWGKISLAGPKFSYPLKLMHAEDFVGERFALIGDAAHGIHPIAGQGVNLGYRDVAVLAQLLEEQRRLGGDLGAASVLARYQRWRKFDSVSMTASTDILNRLFSNKNPLLGAARRMGMAAVNRTPPLKNFFMRHAMGLVGDLPRMMQPPELPKKDSAA